MLMVNPSIRVLLVENHVTWVNLIMEILNFSRDTFELIIAGTLREALTNFRKDEFDIIIIDMQLSDNRGIESFIRLYNQYPDTPLITLTDYSDEQIGLLTVEYGA